MRMALCRLLRSEGFGVAPYASGEEFLNALPGRPPACLLLDLQLPGISGMEVLGMVRGCGLELPAVFITANPDVEIRQQALRSGAAEWLCKPVDQLTLMETISAVFGSHRPGL